jgi:hypothetical protein
MVVKKIALKVWWALSRNPIAMLIQFILYLMAYFWGGMWDGFDKLSPRKKVRHLLEFGACYVVLFAALGLIFWLLFKVGAWLVGLVF